MLTQYQLNKLKAKLPDTAKQKKVLEILKAVNNLLPINEPTNKVQQ